MYTRLWLENMKGSFKTLRFRGENNTKMNSEKLGGRLWTRFSLLPFFTN
jgi:hypothetical protein